MLGYMVIFNGAAIALLGILTGLGVTTENSAKWGEFDALIRPLGLHINAEIADWFGLTILGIGIAITLAGRILSSASGEARHAR
jgi:hypothetical protein